MRREAGKLAKSKMVKTVGLSEFYLSLANLPHSVLTDAIEIAADIDPKAKSLLEQIGHHENQNKTPLDLVMRNNISFATVAKWVMEMANASNRMNTALAMGAILRDVQADARRKPRMCRPCRGTGKLRSIRKAEGVNEACVEERVCPECSGEGFTMAPGHSKSRQMLGEISELIKPAGGASVNIDNRSVTVNAPSVADTVARANRALATASPKMLSSEVVDDGKVQ